MKIDSRKWTTEHIENNVGKLGAQIIVNELIKNEWKMWFVGNTTGNSLYTVDLSSGEKVIVGFTDENVAANYVNKKEIRKGLVKNFGKKLVLVQFSILKITEIMQHNMQVVNKVGPGLLSQSLAPSPINTLIVNPSGADSFIPLHAPLLAGKLLEEGNIEKDSLGEAPVFSLYELDSEDDRYYPADEEDEEIEIP
tara:strand:+ start:297 stop:881 length:585 start_codon:yes stop_codon:yes gene_type:complete